MWKYQVGFCKFTGSRKFHSHVHSRISHVCNVLIEFLIEPFRNAIAQFDARCALPADGRLAHMAVDADLEERQSLRMAPRISFGQGGRIRFAHLQCVLHGQFFSQILFGLSFLCPRTLDLSKARLRGLTTSFSDRLTHFLAHQICGIFLSIDLVGFYSTWLKTQDGEILPPTFHLLLAREVVLLVAVSLYFYAFFRRRFHLIMPVSSGIILMIVIGCHTLPL